MFHCLFFIFRLKSSQRNRTEFTWLLRIICISVNIYQKTIRTLMTVLIPQKRRLNCNLILS